MSSDNCFTDAFSQLYQHKMWKQLVILCACIPSVHYLKEKTISLAMFWLIKIQADVAGISQGNIKESLRRYVPGYRPGSWNWFPFHCCSCWNGLNLIFSSLFAVKSFSWFGKNLKMFIGLHTSSVRAWSQAWLEIVGITHITSGGLKSLEALLLQRISILPMKDLLWKLVHYVLRVRISGIYKWWISSDIIFLI